MTEKSGNKDEKQPEKSNEPSSDATDKLEDKWLMRECDVYYDEYKECTSVRGRFQQLFIWGHTLDCRQWNRDYDNCCKYRDKEDIAAAERVIASERSRRTERLRGHYGNTVWARRAGPPGDWERPLPAWLVERDANTYLALKAREMRGEVQPSVDPHKYCTIM